MGSGDIIAGGKPSARNPKAAPKSAASKFAASKSKAAVKTAIVKSSTKGTPKGLSQTTPGAAERHCGAMSQQRTDSGAVSTPQKFLHLVGCRDPKMRPPDGH